MFTWGGGGYGRTCATRDDEPRPVWTSLPITQHSYQGCVFITASTLIGVRKRIQRAEDLLLRGQECSLIEISEAQCLMRSLFKQKSPKESS
jgi:hypothetical protein